MGCCDFFFPGRNSQIQHVTYHFKLDRMFSQPPIFRAFHSLLVLESVSSHPKNPEPSYGNTDHPFMTPVLGLKTGGNLTPHDIPRILRAEVSQFADDVILKCC